MKSVTQVILSNLTSILSGVLVGFLLPKIISVESYGWYKTFTLYTSYLGFFSLGIIDGIVLKYGEKNYDELDRKRFRSYFKWYCIIHLFLGIIICAIAFLTNNYEYRFVMVALSIYMISNNITGYFQQISQITMRFKELSIRKILQSLFNVIIIAGLYFIFKFGHTITYHYYLTLWISVNVLLTLWYIYTYRDIVFFNSMKLRDTAGDIKYLISIGLPLLLANLCSSLILALDQQFVNILFDTSTYAVYAFAYNMLTLVTVATSAISTVLYPVLKRTDTNNLKKNYDLLVSIMLCFVFAAMIIYFPLSLFIKSFLPKYIDSIIIFRVIFPGLAISSTITVIMHNYYKVLGDNLVFFKKSIVTLFVSGIANFLAFKIFGTTVSISAASIITMIFWYLYVEQFFVDKASYKRGKNFIYMILMIFVFYVFSGIFSEIIGCIVYCCTFAIITLCFYKNRIYDVKKLIIKKSDFNYD